MSFSAAFLGQARAAARLIRRADKARDAGAHAEAAELYSRALDLTPARTDIRVQLRHMLKELRRCQAAEAAYRLALKQSPEEGDIHLQLGHLLKLTGRNEEAIAAYRNGRTGQETLR
jgi:tetratricopeptide (TPR) repeat protein